MYDDDDTKLEDEMNELEKDNEEDGDESEG